MERTIHHVSNGDGWRLALKRIVDPERRDPALRPLVIVPGYGMNAFIFGYHPQGDSMEDYLAKAGFEVWSINLRNQGPTIREGGRKEYGFREVVLTDLPAALDYILDTARPEEDRVDLIGCSLGGTYVYAYAALCGTGRVGSIVGMGAPLRWVEIHPVLGFAFGSPFVAGMLKINHTRSLARLGLPLLTRIPSLLSIYLHPEIVDLSRTDQLVRTVEDPNRTLNREISVWMKNRDLVIDDRNVSELFGNVTNPLLCLLSNADGIVPIPTAMSACELSGSDVTDSFVSGNERVKMAHADMYISHYAQSMVFKPLAEWLKAHSG